MNSSKPNYKFQALLSSFNTIICLIWYLRCNRALIWIILSIISFIITLRWAYLGITRKE